MSYFVLYLPPPSFPSWLLLQVIPGNVTRIDIANHATVPAEVTLTDDGLHRLGRGAGGECAGPPSHLGRWRRVLRRRIRGQQQPESAAPDAGGGRRRRPQLQPRSDGGAAERRHQFSYNRECDTDMPPRTRKCCIAIDYRWSLLLLQVLRSSARRRCVRHRRPRHRQRPGAGQDPRAGRHRRQRHVRGPRGATLLATRSVGDFEFLVSTLIIFPANF